MIAGDAWSDRPYFSSTAKASSKVVGSGAVGPEAMTSSGSPITSEMIRLNKARPLNAWASRPPLKSERCLRTQFISLMVAPQACSNWVTCCLSSSVIPAAGAGNNAEPPPEIRHSSTSCGPAFRAISRIWRVPATPSAVG